MSAGSRASDTPLATRQALQPEYGVIGELDNDRWDRAMRVYRKESVVFWQRFARPPVFDGQSVLEVGCGLGGLCVDIANRGAETVLGIDIRQDDIEFARRFRDRELPTPSDHIRFSCEPLSRYHETQFDYVVSKDSFEHIIDVDGMLAEIRRVLKPGGWVYIGFSPLYHSPYGDHDRRRTAFANLGVAGKLLAALPWGHLLMEKQILRRHSKMRREPVTSMHDLNLNKLKVGEFRKKIQAAGLAAESFLVNQGNNKVGKVLSALRALPGLEDYCTYNVYCILRHAGEITE